MGLLLHHVGVESDIKLEGNGAMGRNGTAWDECREWVWVITLKEAVR